jgi:SAM-dependent methyltransferase
MQDSKHKKVLEIGCGESSFLRSCVESIGGEWIGIDPRAGKNSRESARSIGAQVAYLPFAENSFDIVAGTQTVEHWEDPLTPVKDCSYPKAMKEIRRVLKPGGMVYLDAPMHMHGAPEFILGDIEAIKKVFAYDPWDSLRYLTWRKDCSPLKPSYPVNRQTERWPAILGEKYSPSLKLEQIYLIAFSARKPVAAISGQGSCN